MRVLLDTNAYVAFKTGNTDTVGALRIADDIRLNSVALGKLLAGFAVCSRDAQNRWELAAFLDSP